MLRTVVLTSAANRKVSISNLGSTWSFSRNIDLDDLIVLSHKARCLCNIQGKVLKKVMAISSFLS
jgi:hypothetical protein